MVLKDLGFPTNFKITKRFSVLDDPLKYKRFKYPNKIITI